MNNIELCLSLVRAESESEVISILKNSSFWNDKNKWRFYGDNENNFSSIGNQQSKPEAALVEKIINSVDALLIGDCIDKGLDPEGKQAPSSISDALSLFYGIRDGKLTNIGATERSKLSENISLVATGSKANPCYSIIDRGEGQTPEDIPETILSLNKSNKLRIPFVQGKFNMGGTGVLQFCGRENLQLVISRRRPSLFATLNDNSGNLWGFTIVKRENPDVGVRSSSYKYLAPNGKILTFSSDGLNILPGQYPSAYANKLEWGTFIKLYEYQMPGGLKTNILFDLYNRMSLLMPSIALPVRFFERREGYKGHSMETTLSGLSVRLEEDKKDNLENGFPTSSQLLVHGQKMKASIYAFKKGQSEKYTKDEGIIFTINGQTHGHISKSFFSRKAVGLNYLSDSILVVIDCSGISGRSVEDLFMNSRDRLRDGEYKSGIENILEDLLKNHEGLRQLKENRRREEIEGRIEDSKPLAEIITDMLKKSPSLSKLFIDGVRLPNPFKTKDSNPPEDYNGKLFPTFFHLSNKYTSDNPKRTPKNVKLRVQYKTDVENDFFIRDNDPGIFTLKLNDIEIDDYSLNLWNGTANLNVIIPEDSEAGSLLHFHSEVTDITRIEPFIDDFIVCVEEAINKANGKRGKRKPPLGNNEGTGSEDQSKLALPNVIKVHQDEWDMHSFNKESALKVADSGEGSYDFFINIDNVHLRTEQKSSKVDARLLEARYEYGMVLIGLAILKDYELDKNDDKNGEESENDTFAQIKKFTEILSPILLPMIDYLGDLTDLE